jgi:hypothetical protein
VEENIMAGLSEKEAKDIVEDMLPDIRRGIDMVGKAIIPIPAIENVSSSVKREGNTPDVFCKIAGAAFEHGLATDVDTTKHHGMVMTFSTAKPDYKKPSPKMCETRWKKIKKISDKFYTGPPNL